MDDSPDVTDTNVLTALKRHAARVEQAGPGRWRLWLRNGAAHQGTARVESGWLTVDFAPAGRPPADPWAMLLANAEAPAGVKLTMDEGCGTSHLIGELSLAFDESCELDRRVGELLGGVGGVKDLLTVSKGGKRPAAHEGGAPREVSAPPDAPAAELCREADWPFTERSEGCVAVALEVQRQPFQAVVKPGSNGGLVASVTLAGGREPPRVSHRRALALLLLSASRSVRLARAAAVEEADGRFEARLEAALRLGAGAGDLTDALSALSVACRWCGPEAELVHENSLIAEKCAYSIAGSQSISTGVRPRASPLSP